MTHKKNYLAITFVIFLTLSACASQSNLVGSWAFNVEQTMPEYSKGTLVIEEAGKNEYGGKIILDTGREFPLHSVSLEDNTVTFTASVDGSLVTTVCTLDDDMLTGSVRTSDGSLPFSAQKKVE